VAYSVVGSLIQNRTTLLWTTKAN